MESSMKAIFCGKPLLAVMLFVVVIGGCRFVPEERIQHFSIMPGKPISLEEVPDAVMQHFRKACGDEVVPTVECIKDGEVYRFKLPAGEVYHFSQKGQLIGGVI